MALSDKYVQVYGKFPEFFKAISEGQAPEQFTRQHLKDIGFGSANFRAVIPLLKELGFLTDEGAPTQRYHEYRNQALSRKVMGQALKQAYGDLFVIKSKPADDDKPLIEGKFKSAHNVSERIAKLMSGTFYALMALADVAEAPAPGVVAPPKIEAEPSRDTKREDQPKPNGERPSPLSAAALPGLHYNVQIHLPATKDVEVFNAIFKSLKEHFLA